MTERKYTPEDLAAISGFTVATVMSWIRKKKLQAKRTRRYLINAEDMRTFLLGRAATKRRTVN